MQRRNWLPSVVVVILFSTACGGDSTPTQPEIGALAVSVNTEGSTPDPDGYVVKPGEETGREIAVDGTVFFPLQPGTYRLSFSGLASNCRTTKAPSASVWPGDTTQVEAEIECEQSVQDRIVFSSLRDGEQFDIYSMAPDGSDVRRITTGANLVATDINDAGTEILAVGPVSGAPVLEHDLHMVSLAGSSHQISSDSTYQLWADLSPDGSDIIYDAFDTTGVSESWSWSIYRRTSNGTGAETPVLSDSIYTRTPSWAPDGNTIAFARLPSDSGHYDLYTADAEGSNLMRITRDTSRDQWFPVYSPSAARLAYIADGDLAVRQLESDNTSIFNSDHTARAPHWMPGGQKLVYYSFAGDVAEQDDEIYRISADGSDLTQLTDNSVRDVVPVVANWSSN